MDLSTAVYILIFLLSIAFLLDQITKRIPTRRDTNYRPKSRFELVPVAANAPLTRADGVDIIFIHGLGSNPDTAWQAASPSDTTDAPEGRDLHRKKFANWVSDFLPEDLPEAVRNKTRLFFYNYDSYWGRDAVDTRLENLGFEFLEHISRDIRVSEAERSRNLIFVGHSYGGLIIKKALVRAQTNRRFSHIADHTKAIIFLGTPHRGSSFSIWGWLWAKAIQPLGSNPSILANLGYDSTPLQELHSTFVEFAGRDVRVFNFFEKRPTVLFRLRFIQWTQFCVREQSAAYAGPEVQNIGLSVDHRGLNKFGSRSEDYRAILGILKEVTVGFAGSLRRCYSVPFQLVQTFTERTELSKELEAKLRIRHENASTSYAVAIHGLGGAGKSQLSLAYAEKHKYRYNPILWIDATDEEVLRSSFERCSTELGLPKVRVEKHRSVQADGEVQAVLRWLCERTEADDEWLVIVDNADDFSWGIQKIMPKGKQGSIIITSQDKQSVQLVSGACEQVRIGEMSPSEGVALLLKHLRLDAESAHKNIQYICDEVAKKLGYLALAIDLAGSYIVSDISHKPASDEAENALLQYLAYYDAHRDDLLKMDYFRGLRPTNQTVWTVWDTTLRKIMTEYPRLQLDVFLAFLAQFRGSTIQDELFRLASLGMAKIDAYIDGEASSNMPDDLRQYIQVRGEGWDSFQYDQCCKILVRYSLLQRVEGTWAGVTMHSLVQWRAKQSNPSRLWNWCYTVFLVAASSRIRDEEQSPEFRRHLIVHIPGFSEDYAIESEYALNKNLVREVFGGIYYHEGRWGEAKTLQEEAVEESKTRLGADHVYTLASMANLASTYQKQGRSEEAEKLRVEVIETYKTKLGADHPDTLTSMSNLSSIYWSQGRLKEAEKLRVEVMEKRKTKLGEDHPDTLTSVANLASIYWSQGRLEDAEKLDIEVIEKTKTKLGADHPDTLSSVANLASTYSSQGRLEDAEKLEVEVLEKSKTKLGPDHPDTITSIANLASTYWSQGRLEEAEKLDIEVMEKRKTRLGASHPSTLRSIGYLVSTYRSQGRWEEAETLQAELEEARAQSTSAS